MPGRCKGLRWGWRCCLPLYAIGGMGAGDVKLLAGVGAWVGPAVTFWAFATSVVVGAVMALVDGRLVGRVHPALGAVPGDRLTRS